MRAHPDPSRPPCLRHLPEGPEAESRPGWIQAVGLLGWVVVGLLLAWPS